MQLFDCHGKRRNTLNIRDIYDIVKADTGISLILHGAKKADSSWRRRNMATTKGWTDVVYPIAEWSKHDVWAYVNARDLRPPQGQNRNANGIDLTPSSLLWLHDNHPRDFQRLCNVFPYAEAVVWRRSFFGVDS